MENRIFSSVSLIVFLYKWKRELIIVAVASILLSTIFSMPFFIKPKYKSKVIMFPTLTNSLSKAILSDNPGSKQNILEYGDEERADQLLQILNSYEIKMRIIDKYKLMEHYEISKREKYPMTKLFKEFEDNIKFRRTEYMSVEITVYDYDPQMAADMANDIAAFSDTISYRLQRERAIAAYKILEDEYNNSLLYMKEMEDSLSKIMKAGVNDYESQAEVFNEQLAIAIRNNNYNAVKELEKKLAIIGEYGAVYISLVNKIKEYAKQLNYVKSKYDEAKIDAENFLPNKFIVDKAFKAEKKSYPIRWLIVLIVTVSSLLIASIVIVSIEKFKNINIKERLNIGL